MAGRIPPHSPEAESAVLGECLHSADAAKLVVESLDASSFFDPRNQQAFRAVRALFRRGSSISARLLVPELEQAGMENPRMFVVEVLDGAAGTIRSVRDAISIILDRAQRRKALEIAASVERAASNGADLAALDPLGQELQGLGAPVRDQVRTLRVSEIRAERVSWLWFGRIPRGKLTVLDGDPGLGKSTLTLDLAARVSTGSPMPDGEKLDGPSGVLLLTAEDGIADTIRPRLEAAGGDSTRIMVLSGIKQNNGTQRSPEIPLDTGTIERRVLEESVALVVIDPLMAFLGSNVDSWRDQDVRRALYSLSVMAERTGVAVLMVRHLTKSGGSHAIYRGGGSIGIIGAARSGLLVAVDPADEQRRVLATTKSNLAAIPDALAYRLVNHELTGAARIVWEGRTQHKASDLLSVHSDTRDSIALEEATEFLLDLLAEGPLPSSDVREEARGAGLSWITVRRAKETLLIRARKVGAPGSNRQFWAWALPEDAHETAKVLTPGERASSETDEHLRDDNDEHSAVVELLQRELGATIVDQISASADDH